MVHPLTLKLTLFLNETISDASGAWQHAGATAVVSGLPDHPTATLIATKRESFNNVFKPPASMLTATVMFPPASSGQVPPNLTLQGIHVIASNNESGSVSAASQELVAYLGAPFTFEASTGTLTITPTR